MRNVIKSGDMSMMKMGILAAAVALAGASSATAARNYGQAGCGLGSVAFGKTGNQILAGTTNGTSANQLFGISSGTLNCSEDGVALAEKEKEYFTNANFENLMQEMAQGSGENLQAMAALYGCSTPEFSSTMQANYGKLFPGADADSEAMRAGVEELIETDNALKGACTELN